MQSRIRLFSFHWHVLLLYAGPVVLMPTSAQTRQVGTASDQISPYRSFEDYEELLSNGHASLSSNEENDDGRAWTSDLDSTASSSMLELRTRTENSSRAKKSLERIGTFESKGHAFIDTNGYGEQNEGHAVLDGGGEMRQDTLLVGIDA